MANVMGYDSREYDTRDKDARDEGRPDDRKDHLTGPVETKITTRFEKLEVDDLEGFAKVGFLDVEKFVKLKDHKLFIEKKLPFAVVVLSQDRRKKDRDKKDYDERDYDRDHDRKDDKKFVIVESRVHIPVEVQEDSSDDLSSTSVVGFIDVEKVVRAWDKEILIEKKLPFHILVLRPRDDKKKDRRDGERDKDGRDKDGRDKD